MRLMYEGGHNFVCELPHSVGMAARPGNDSLTTSVISALLFPEKPEAVKIRRQFEDLAFNGFDSGILFMALAHLLGGWIPLLAYGSKLQVQGVSEAGNGILALAMTEKESGSDAFAMRAEAITCQGEWHLKAEKCFITNAPLAKFFLIFAKTPGAGVSCFLIPREQSGVAVRETPAMMGLHSARFGQVSVNSVLPGVALIGNVGDGPRIFQAAMAWERSLILSAAPGVLLRLLVETCERARSKIRFGRPLVARKEFQDSVLQVREIVNELRGLAIMAAENLDSGNCSIHQPIETKARSSVLYEKASRLLLQLRGAEGYFEHSAVSENFLNSLASSIYSGPNDLLESLVKAD